MENLTGLFDVLEKLVLLILMGLSVWSLAIIFNRFKVLKDQSQIKLVTDLKKVLVTEGASQARQYLVKNKTLSSNKDTATAAADSKAAPSEDLFLYGGAQVILDSGSSSEGIDRALSAFIKSEKMNLEKGLAVLATLGANAPFIGLFGTVLGIIRSFSYLGNQSGAQQVISGVSQALVATAVGLIVAIPAVVAYNIFAKKIKDLVVQLESFRDLYISQLRKAEVIAGAKGSSTSVSAGFSTSTNPSEVK